MSGNGLGRLFRVTTWGESHGKALGAVIEGCPSQLELDESYIQAFLDQRAPGKPYVSQRKEKDRVEILSGVFEGQTTGTPISLLVRNEDARSRDYASLRHLLRPGHAQYGYLEKYGIFDYRGGGRASGRETVCRVMGGAVAQKVLDGFGVQVFSTLEEVGGKDAQEIESVLEEAAWQGDSVGGVVGFCVEGLPAGLGEPVFDKLEAMVAKALMSIPAVKGVEFGAGFQAAAMRGSEHNDIFGWDQEAVRMETNRAGGVLGGISTGEPFWGRVSVKPTSSIAMEQKTVTTCGQEAFLRYEKAQRHDPCIALRARYVVEAMLRIVMADAMLLRTKDRVLCDCLPH